MSYFVAGRVKSDHSLPALAEIFDQDIPDDVWERQIQSIDDESFVRCYVPPKTIGDILIKHRNGKSWLLLSGAPLIGAKTDEEKQSFVESFFNAPKPVLRSQVDGHFALLAFDAENQAFYAASDAHSLIPIYFALPTEGVLFCSGELPVAKSLKLAWDDFGLAQSIHYGAVWGTGTRFQGLSKLDPCEIVRIAADKTLTRERYWEPSEESLWTGSFDTVMQQWSEVMVRTIRAFIDHAPDQLVSSDLTGGKDSRLIVAILHHLGRPFSLRVSGSDDDIDVVIARAAAKKLELDLAVQSIRPINEGELTQYMGRDMCRAVFTNDLIGSFFTQALTYAHESDYPPIEYSRIHLCGLPGGCTFRGAYYLRAKLFFPTIQSTFDHREFTRLKFLLGFMPGLLKLGDDEYFERVYELMEKCLDEVRAFPAGTQVDHLIRVRQNCLLSVNVKRPFYFAFTLREMTRSIYNVPPHMKQGGRQMKAITEKLFPELALIKTQKGVPTIRRRWYRAPLFLPEYFATLKGVAKGVARYKLGISGVGLKGTTAARHHALTYHDAAVRWLFNSGPYASWFRSPQSMLSGQAFNFEMLEQLLMEARQGNPQRIQLLGRIVNQEMAFRYVYGDG